MHSIHYDTSRKLLDLLPVRIHVASFNEFKSSRARLLTLSCVTTCFNSLQLLIPIAQLFGK